MGLDWQRRPVSPDLARSYRAAGYWTDEALGHLLVDALADRPDARCSIRSTSRPFEGTFAGVLDGARRVAGGLARHGVGPGDAVAFQLPNCVEAALVFYGASLLGAVVVPIVHFYGPKEVRYILGRSGARLLVTADRFRGIEFLDLLEAVVVDTPALERVFVAGEEHGRWAPFSD